MYNIIWVFFILGMFRNEFDFLVFMVILNYEVGIVILKSKF